MMTRDEKIGYWRGIQQEHAESGLTGAGFCREKDIPVKRFRWWMRRLREIRQEPRPTDDQGFVELLPVPERRSSGAEWSGVSLEVDGGLRISLSRVFDAETLQAVLHVVGVAAR